MSHKKVIEKLDRLMSNMRYKKPSSYPDQRYKAGYLQGLEDAKTILEESK